MAGGGEGRWRLTGVAGGGVLVELTHLNQGHGHAVSCRYCCLPPSIDLCRLGLSLIKWMPEVKPDMTQDYVSSA